MYQTIKQLEEKNVAQEIETLVWSDRMDLVAFSNVKGEVALHRLTWARAWNLAPHKEGITVKNMAWRPDSKVIAIAYSTGEVFLINIENKNLLHKIEVEGEISCLQWIQAKKTNKTGFTLVSEDEEAKDCSKYGDNSSTFLADLQPLSSSATQQNEEKLDLCQNQNSMNLLIIGTRKDISEHLGCKCSIISVLFLNDLSTMFVTVRDVYGSIKLVILDTEIFRTHKHELFAVASKHGHLGNFVSYLSNTIATIKEAWETILLEMDAKLKKYASKVPEGTMTADFLDLLMFGITSLEMQEFLKQDLTDKDLKKFGQVIETSYTNIQKLLLKNLMKVGQNITYHLAELRGMARFKHRFEIIGLSEDFITSAIMMNGAFLSKGGEMQQIINQSMINYKAFFRWLYTAIVHLMDEQIPPEMPKMTQQDVGHITEFILNFDHIGTGKGDTVETREGFTMERLGQYLENAPLTIPMNVEENIWHNFLLQNECVREHPDIIKRHQNNSLVQQFHILEATIANIFEQPKKLLSDKIKLKHVIGCLQTDGDELIVSKINYTDSAIFIAVLDKKVPGSGIFLAEIMTDAGEIAAKGAYFYFPQPFSTKAEAGNCYSILDFKFYSVNILSLLLQEENNVKATGVLYQFPINLAREKLVAIELSQGLFNESLPRLNGSEFTPATMKSLEDMVCSTFAVSGARKVSIVLSKNRKKVQLFEMEADEEEEEDADMTSSVVENDS